MSREVPEGWAEAQLGSVARCEMGETLIQKDLTGDGIPVFSANTDDGPWGWTSHAKKRFRRGTIIVGARGSLGHPRLPDYDTFVSTQTTIAIHPSASVSPRFLLYALQSIDLDGRGAKQAVPMLTVKAVNEVPLWLPPIDQQRRIAEILSSVDEAIQATQAVIEQTRKVKQGVLKRLLTKGIGHTRFKQTEIGEIPEGWEVIPLGSVIKLTSGKLKSVKSLGSQNSEQPYPVYGGNGIAGYDRDYLLDASVIIIGRVGEYCGAIHRANGKIWVTDNALYTKEILRPCDLDYLSFAIGQIPLSRIRGGGGQPLVSQKPLYEQFIPFPPPDEQRQIAYVASAIDQHLAAHAFELNSLQTTKSALMSDLLTGRKRVIADLPMAAE